MICTGVVHSAHLPPPPSTLITLTTRPHSSLLQHALTHHSYHTPSLITLTTRPHSSLLLHALTHHSYSTPSLITPTTRPHLSLLQHALIHHSYYAPSLITLTTHPHSSLLLHALIHHSITPLLTPSLITPSVSSLNGTHDPPTDQSGPDGSLPSLSTLGSRARVRRTSNPLLTAPWGLVPVS